MGGGAKRLKERDMSNALHYRYYLIYLMGDLLRTRKENETREREE